jgi:hypothetical protein
VGVKDAVQPSSQRSTTDECSSTSVTQLQSHGKHSTDTNFDCSVDQSRLLQQ